jgi:hypothetical protein
MTALPPTIQEVPSEPPYRTFVVRDHGDPVPECVVFAAGGAWVCCTCDRGECLHRAAVRLAVAMRGAA